MSKQTSDLFIVDNSDSDWKVRSYLKDWCELSSAIVVALSETIRLMSEIDGVIETHGGWPSAFQSANVEKLKL